MPLVGHSPRWTLDSPQQLRFIIQKEKRATSSIVVHEQPHQLRPALEIADRTTVGEEQRNERPKSPLTTTAAPLSLDRRDNSNQRIYVFEQGQSSRNPPLPQQDPPASSSQYAQIEEGGTMEQGIETEPRHRSEREGTPPPSTVDLGLGN